MSLPRLLELPIGWIPCVTFKHLVVKNKHDVLDYLTTVWVIKLTKPNNKVLFIKPSEEYFKFTLGLQGNCWSIQAICPGVVLISV